MYTRTPKGYAKAPVPMKETSEPVAGPGKPVEKFSIAVTEEDRKAVSKDPLTQRVFGERAPEIYAAGLRPSIGQDGSFMYMPTSDNFRLENGDRVGFRMNKQNDKFSIVYMNPDGSTREFDQAQGELVDLDPKAVIDFVSKVYTKRYNDIVQK